MRRVADRLARCARGVASGPSGRERAIGRGSSPNATANPWRGVTKRRWFGDAREEAAKAPTTASKISEGLGTAALVVGAGVGCVVGGSMYASTTEELAKRVEAGEHVPTTMRGTPLEGAYGGLVEQVLKFRQWMDDQSHNYLDPILSLIHI